MINSLCDKGATKNTSLLCTAEQDSCPVELVWQHERKGGPALLAVEEVQLESTLVPRDLHCSPMILTLPTSVVLGWCNLTPACNLPGYQEKGFLSKEIEGCESGTLTLKPL